MQENVCKMNVFKYVSRNVCMYVCKYISKDGYILHTVTTKLGKPFWKGNFFLFVHFVFK